jgi:hypothetical protein
MFGIFTELTREEPMPTAEQVCAWLKRLFRPAVLISIAVIAVLAVLMFSMPLRSRCGVALVGSRAGQAWSRSRSCLPVPANPPGVLPDRSGK